MHSNVVSVPGSGGERGGSEWRQSDGLWSGETPTTLTGAGELSSCLSVVVSMWDCRGRSVVRMISSATNLILSLLSLGQSNILKYKETLKLIRKIFDINHLENVDNVDYSKVAWQWLPLNLFYRLSRQDVLRLVTFCHTLGGWCAGNHRDYSD